MVGEGIEARAGTTNVIRSWGYPSVFTSNINQLVFIEGGEWYIPWSTLSFLVLFVCLWCISFLNMLHQVLGVLKGSFCIRTEGQGCGR